MQRSFNQSCLWAICLSIFCTPILFAQSKQPPAQRWEYFTAQFCNHNIREFNKYGDEGWELVAVFGEQNGSCGYYTFKRLKPADAPKYVEPQTQSPPPSKSAAPTCNLLLAQAPTIRGLRLGMTVDELIELFPGANPNELRLSVEKAAGYSSFGHSSFSFRGDQHKERLEIPGFHVTLFDGRVRSFIVEYRFSNATYYGSVFSNEQIIDKLIESLNLPPKEIWKSEYPGKVLLSCQGFKLTVHAQSNLGITVEDTSPSYAEKLKQRQAQDAAKKQAEFKP